METSKASLDKALNNLVKLKMSLFNAGDWTGWPLKVPSNTNHSMILGKKRGLKPFLKAAVAVTPMLIKIPTTVQEHQFLWSFLYNLNTGLHPVVTVITFNTFCGFRKYKEEHSRIQNIQV